jgi:5-formyltetrahydrofolate cyclo-ligase
MTEFKNKMRALLKEKRKKIEPSFLKQKSKEVCDIFLSSKLYKESKSIFCYVPYSNEIDTRPILNRTLLDSKVLLIPKVIGKDMIAVKANNLNDLIKNSYGILEPISDKPYNKEDIDIIIVPALGFNNDGHRIGFGGGYYDRYLADYEGATIGFVLKDFIIDNFDQEPKDVPVKELIIV